MGGYAGASDSAAWCRVVDTAPPEIHNRAVIYMKMSAFPHETILDCINVSDSCNRLLTRRWLTPLSRPQMLEACEEVEYKFLLVGSEGKTIEWLPGDNKTLVVPAFAGMLEIDDTWTSDPPKIRVLQDASGLEVFPPQEMPPPRSMRPAVESPPPPPPPPAVAEPVPSAADVAGSSYDEASLKKMKVVELKVIARGLELGGFSKLKKAELIALILDNSS